MKIEKLRDTIKGLGEVSVAFSGGVDSTLVSKIAYEVLGDKATAVTVVSEFTGENDISGAIKTAEEIGIKHKIIKVKILDGEIKKNPENRCYLCKVKILSSIPGKNIIDGTNADDDEKRPGMRALREFGVYTPLKELGIGKWEIRQLAKEYGLSNHNKESNSCLATRIPFHSEITKDKLNKIEIAENALNEEKIYNIRARLVNDKFVFEIPAKYLKKYEDSTDKIKNRITKTNIKTIELRERE